MDVVDAIEGSLPAFAKGVVILLDGNVIRVVSPMEVLSRQERLGGQTANVPQEIMNLLHPHLLERIQVDEQIERLVRDELDLVGGEESETAGDDFVADLVPVFERAKTEDLFAREDLFDVPLG